MRGTVQRVALRWGKGDMAAACMWQNPHILVLDEPTNYLDSDGLGALVLATKDYEGGLLIMLTTRRFVKCRHGEVDHERRFSASQS